MSTHKAIDRICCVVLAFTILITVLFMNAERFGVQKVSAVMEYEQRLFDTNSVHTLDIVMKDWDEFVKNCKSEEYYNCSVVIDGEAFKNVAIRGKGNTSLTQVAAYGNDRYSFKIEFDHYDSTKTYYGLDKLCLNNIIQDNTYMKDYLSYRMMAENGAVAPLCSYVYITVNGEDWGLYLAVEAVEESFLQRNYGKDYGELYKPDSMNMGGGRGNGKEFEIDKFLEENESATENEMPEMPQGEMPEMPQGEMPEMPGGRGQRPGGMRPGGQGMPQMPQMPENMQPPTEQQPNGETMQNFKPGGMGRGSEDVLLKYIDDSVESYQNIFDSAKTEVTKADQKRLISALKKLSMGEDLADTVEIEKVIRYFAVHNFVLNFDSYTGAMIHNYYLYEKDGQMQMIPWDYNLAFGGFQSMGDATTLVNYPIDSPVSGGNTEDRPMIAWIFASEEYTELYHQYLSEFMENYFESGYFAEMIEGVSAMIAPYVEKDPTKFCTYEQFETGVATLREFCLLRAKSVRGQLEGTIGATTETQDKATLIDAGELNISDMGSMGNRKNDNSGMQKHPADFISGSPQILKFVG